MSFLLPQEYCPTNYHSPPSMYSSSSVICMLTEWFFFPLAVLSREHGFVAACGLSLAAGIRGYFSLWWLLFLQSMGSRPKGLVAPRHVESSRTRDQTHVPRFSRQILNHCSTREVQLKCFDCERSSERGGYLLNDLLKLFTFLLLLMLVRRDKRRRKSPTNQKYRRGKTEKEALQPEILSVFFPSVKTFEWLTYVPVVHFTEHYFHFIPFLSRVSAKL